MTTPAGVRLHLAQERRSADGPQCLVHGAIGRFGVEQPQHPRAPVLGHAGHGRVAIGEDTVMQLTGVIPATRLVLKKAGLSIDEMDWIEINEAFATVVLSWADELEPDMDRVNPWGGAIAHGHPLGATGAGLMAKMLAGLEATDGRFGLQVMCIGHGMSTATILERI